MSDQATRIQFKALDGLPLVGYLYDKPQARAAILVGCATAVRQRFYFPFVRWLHAQGYNCLTFDYRGLGESLNASSAKDSDARKQDWGELDLPGALAHLNCLYPNLDKHLVGHSAGGALVGLMPNYGLLKSVVAIGCTTGYLNNITMPYRLVAGALLHGYFPVALSTFGYLPAKKMGWGEDLPAGVARQWAEWCTHPGYVKNAFGKEIKQNFYDQLEMPILILNSVDDPIATKANVDDLLSLFPRAQARAKWLKPKDYGLIAAGHMGFFWARNQPFWSEVLPGLDS